jgi:hypothetical protein
MNTVSVTGVLLSVALLTGCILAERFALGREYMLVNLGGFLREPGPPMAACDDVWQLKLPHPSGVPISAFVCRFDGVAPTPHTAPEGMPPYFRVLHETIESLGLEEARPRVSVIRANGTPDASKRPLVRPIPSEILEACPPPPRLSSGMAAWGAPLTDAELAALHAFERCLEPKLTGARR